jgi:hypothetical protein
VLNYIPRSSSSRWLLGWFSGIHGHLFFTTTVMGGDGVFFLPSAWKMIDAVSPNRLERECRFQRVGGFEGGPWALIRMYLFI